MKVLEMQQGSSEWLAHRKSKITASEVGIILGVSPYMTALQLWELKTNKVDAAPPNAAMQRGLDLEPVARELVERRFEMTFNPLVVEDGNLMASLDGYNAVNRVVWEHKCCGREEHLKTPLIGPPQKYLYQCQFQLMLTGAEKLLFTTMIKENNEWDLAHYWVYPDHSIFELIKDVAAAFYLNIVNNVPPALSDKDYKERTDDGWKQAATDYINMSARYDTAELQLEQAKQRLIRLSDHTRSKGYGVSLNIGIRKGNIDYGKIVALNELNLDEYRKPSSEVITVKIL